MPETDYRALWEEAARNALIWRDRFEKDEELLDGIAGAVHDLRFLWEPRKRGYAQARECHKNWCLCYSRGGTG